MSSQFRKIKCEKKKIQNLCLKKKASSTIQNYIDKKLKLVEFKQHIKRQQSMNSSNQSILFKSFQSSKTSQKPNFTLIQMEHRKSGSYQVNNSLLYSKAINTNEFVDTNKDQLFSIKANKDKPINELNILRIENSKLKAEINECKFKIRSLEKSIETALAENYPIDITKCPKPMPYINNYYNFNYYTNNHTFLNN